jgi:hypothetical protein
MDEVERLFEVLKRDGYYTKSFEEFKEQYADESYREKVYEVMSRDKYYTKSRDEFFQQYSVGDSDVEVVKTPTYQSTTLKTKDDEVVEEEEEEVVFEPTEEGKFKVGIEKTKPVQPEKEKEVQIEDFQEEVIETEPKENIHEWLDDYTIPGDAKPTEVSKTVFTDYDEDKVVDILKDRYPGFDVETSWSWDIRNALPTLQDMWIPGQLASLATGEKLGFNFNAAKITNPTNGESITIGLDTKGNLLDQSQDNKEKLINFIDNNIDALNKDQYDKNKNDRINRAIENENTSIDEGGLGISEDQINETKKEVEDIDLSPRLEKRPTGGPLAKTYGDVLVQPYEKEIAQAEKILLSYPVEQGYKPSKEDIYAKAKEIIYNKRITEIEVENREKWGKENPDKVADQFSGDVDLSLEIKNQVQAEESVYENLINQYESKVIQGRAGEIVRNFNETYENPNAVFSVAEGEDVLVLPNGKKISQQQYQEVREASNYIKIKSTVLEEQKKKLDDLVDKAGDIELSKDILRRDYNLWEKSGYTITSGFSDIAINTLYYAKSFSENTATSRLALWAGRKLAPKQNEIVNKFIDDAFFSYKDWSGEIKDSYARDVSFEKALNLGNEGMNWDDFGIFALQEISTQIPILTTIAATGGAGTAIIGASSGGGYILDSDYQEALTGEKRKSAIFEGEDRSDFETFLIGTGFGVAEGGFEALTTLPMLKRGWSLIGKEGKKPLVRETLYQYLKANTARSLVYDPASESIAEGLTQVTQNYLDGRPISEGVDHAMFSGLMMGTVMSYSPYIAGAATSAYYNKDNKLGLQTQELIKEKNELLKDINNMDSKLTTLPPSMKKQWKKSKMERIATINTMIEANINSLTGNVFNNIEGEAAEYFFETQLELEKTRSQASDIIKAIEDGLVSKADGQQQLSILKKIYDVQKQNIYDFRNAKNFGDSFNLLEENVKKEYNDKATQEIINKKAKEGLTLTEEDISPKEIKQEANKLYVKDKINENKDRDIKLLKALNIDVKEFKTNAEAAKWYQKNFKDTDPDFEQNLQDIKEGNINGFNPTGGKRINGRGQIMFVEEAAINNYKTETRSHELTHTILFDILGDSKTNPELYSQVANQIALYLKQTNETAYNSMFGKLTFVGSVETAGKTTQPTIEIDGKNFLAEEVLTNFIELVGKKRIELDGKNKPKFSGLLGTMLNGLYSSVTGKNIPFKGDMDVINFVQKLGEKIADGTLTKENVREFKEQLPESITKKDDTKVKDIKQKPKDTKVAASKKTDTKFSKQAGETINEVVGDAKTPSEVQAKVYEKLLAADAPVEVANLIDNVIKQQLIREGVNVEGPDANIYNQPLDEFIQEVKDQLLDKSVMRFDETKAVKKPDGSYDVGGYLISELVRYRIGDVLKKYRPKAGQKSIDVSDTEGRVMQYEDISAESKVTDVDLTKAKKPINLRRALDIKEGSEIYNKVKDVVKKTFGTKLPSPTDPKFKKVVQDAFANELMSSVKELMGKPGSDKYKTFLQQYGEQIYDLIPQDVLNKSFEEFIIKEKENISPKEVDKAISEGLLPKDTPRTSGPTLFTRKKFDQQAWSDYHLAPTKGRPASKQTQLAQTIGKELGKDAVLEVLEDPKAFKRFTEIQELQGKKVTSETKAKIAEKIGREPGIKFSRKLDKLKNIESINTKSVENLGRTYNALIKEGKGNDIIYLDKLPEFIERINIGEDVNSAFINTYGNEFLTSGKNQTPLKIRKNIIKDWETVVSNFPKQKFVTDKPSQRKLNEYLHEAFAEQTQREEVQDILGLNKESVDFTKTGITQLENFANSLINYFSDVRETFNNDLDFYKYILQHYGTMSSPSKIGNMPNAIWKQDNKGVWRIVEGPKTKRGTGQRYGLFNNSKELVNVLIKQAFDTDNNIKVVGKKTKDGKPTKGYDVFYKGKKIEIQRAPQSDSATAKYLNEFKKTGALSNNTLTNSYNDAIANQEAIIDYLDYYKNNKDKGITLNDVGMYFMTSTSGMTQILRSAYPIDSISVSESSNPNDYRFEHNPPVRVMKVYMAQYIDGKITKNELKNKFKDASVSVVPKLMDDVINIRYKDTIPLTGTSRFSRYFNSFTFGKFPYSMTVFTPKFNKKGEITSWEKSTRGEGFKKAYDKIQKAKEINIGNINKSKVVKYSKKSTNSEVIREAEILDKALNIARDPNAPVKKIRVFDFDDTLARTKSNVLYTMPDGKSGKLTAEEFAKRGTEMLEQGAEFDFSEFNKVMKGRKGPLFDVAKKIQEARGTKDVFVLTARAAAAAPAIKEFLDSVGLNIPIENITGLGDSSPLAKSNWIVDKAADGYNDFYFADDHLGNVDAVKRVLDVIDVKSKVQQAKVKFSKNVNEVMNTIIFQKTGIAPEKQFAEITAQARGRKKISFNLIPPSAQDFGGLLYKLLSKGELGNKQWQWMQEHLIKPYGRAMNDLSVAQNQLMADFRALKESLVGIPKNLKKEAIKGFTNEDVVRVATWDRQGIEVEGISKRDLDAIRKYVEGKPDLNIFIDQLIAITKGDGYYYPGKNWLAGTITTDFREGLRQVTRKNLLQQWQENVDLAFNESNMNKIEAAFGPKYREALENSLQRMSTGQNRRQGMSRVEQRFLDYINNSVGAVMFLNARSAVLQTISAANFINWKDNNPMKAALAFANQKQYWSDFMTLMNSDFLVDRRNGLKINVSESEIAEAAKTSKNTVKGVISYLLNKGFVFTQIADSFAIASGGATLYRNRIKTYMKEGMSEAEATEKAFLDFRELAEESQQSARADKISQQQASTLGRLVLAFANTPSQYARIMDKAGKDLISGRGDWKANMSKIAYYGFVQNLMFTALQSALFALAAGDDDDEEAKIPEEKIISTANSMADNILKGIGVHGVIISAAKNTIMDLIERSQKDPYFNPDAPSFPGPEYTDAISKLIAISPPLSIKLRKIKGGITDWYFNRWRPEAGEIFNINNPSYRAASKVIAGVTNVPLDRLFQKIENIQGAMDDVNPTWQRIFMALGWPKWQLETEKEKEKRKATEKKEKRNIRAEDKPSIYNKAEQVNILKQYGLTETEIKKLKNEDQRVKKIEALRKKTNKIYIPKNVKKEKTKTKEKKAKEKKKSSPFSTRLKNKKLTTTFN